MAGDISQLVYALGRVQPTGLNLLGTGFAVTERLIATAFHVVGADDRDLALVVPKVRTLGDYQDTSDTSVQMLSLRLVSADPIRDLSLLEISSDASISTGVEIGSTDEAPPGTAVVAFGFPHAPMGRMVLTQHIPHVGARVLIAAEGHRCKHLVLNTQAREGQSGGPVLLAGSNRIVAVLLGSYAPGGGGQISIGGVDPATLHQTTHAISAEYLEPML